jgi:hypothetical protein
MNGSAGRIDRTPSHARRSSGSPRGPARGGGLRQVRAPSSANHTATACRYSSGSSKLAQSSGEPTRPCGFFVRGRMGSSCGRRGSSGAVYRDGSSDATATRNACGRSSVGVVGPAPAIFPMSEVPEITEAGRAVGTIAGNERAWWRERDTNMRPPSACSDWFAGVSSQMVGSDSTLNAVRQLARSSSGVSDSSGEIPFH